MPKRDAAGVSMFARWPREFIHSSAVLAASGVFQAQF